MDSGSPLISAQIAILVGVLWVCGRSVPRRAIVQPSPAAAETSESEIPFDSPHAVTAVDFQSLGVDRRSDDNRQNCACECT